MALPDLASTIPIRQKIIFGFIAALLMLGVVAGMASRSTVAFIKAAALVDHTRQILETEDRMVLQATEAESAARGGLLAGTEVFAVSFLTAQKLALESAESLAVLCGDNSSQTERAALLGDLLRRKLELLSRAMTLRLSEGQEPAALLLATAESAQTNREFQEKGAEFLATERALLAERAEFTKAIGQTTRFSVFAATGLATFLLTIGCIFILRDITARRRAESALAEQHNLLGNVMDAMPEHVFVKDLTGRYVIDNAAHRRFIDVKEPASVKGKTAFDYYPHEMAEMYAITDRTVLETQHPLVDHEEPTVDREGRLIWLSTTKVPLRDIDGTLIGLVGVSMDISARKAAEEELRLTTAQLRRSNSDLNDFASVASHDLQEPLRKIMAFGDRLRMKCAPALGEVGNDYLARMSGAAQRMQRLIQDLLTLSRVTSKAQPFVETDLAEILQDVVSDLELRIEQTGAIIEVGGLPEIDADPLQMRQLFLNLISNALKFQPSGEKPVVKISGRILEVQEPQIPGAAPGDQICHIVVEDNGIGFDPKFAEQIFTVFQRLHGRLEFEGTGIGLAVVRKIADRHGGIVVAKSSEGQGASFIVTLPVKQRMKHHHDETR